MEHQHVPGRQDKRQDSRTPILEWIAAAIGLLLTLAMLGFISWQAWRSTGEELPAIKVQVQRIVPAADGWVVEIAALNLSAATGAAVQIEGELKQGERVVATSQVTLDYVPGNSEQRGGLFFREDPRAHVLEVRALGYAKP
ncbi:TIGR02588 family protein [Paracoccus benzoatiresistens]|uniref:TIGR02588 family protein n=1 Tax=Paracoccus benzoatiresistens TaxID=2997341 RepID=A0ABT4J5G5_9RHOB|nr:TIGR02588 family protein [Paracoccus sp. EF6]MCZ0962365.1 TIGR02588 family protein [Paracoccus sp. EF6]